MTGLPYSSAVRSISTPSFSSEKMAGMTELISQPNTDVMSGFPLSSTVDVMFHMA